MTETALYISEERTVLSITGARQADTPLGKKIKSYIQNCFKWIRDLNINHKEFLENNKENKFMTLKCKNIS